ncbi:MAG TPA: SDR family oxidoreductase [Paenalcaligenes sp.]|nr:SDR family oxidoreductase [Paenalcaligenes sp.]
MSKPAVSSPDTPVTTAPKTALITGAAHRLGKAIALALAQQGWDIVLHYNSSVSQAEQTAEQIRALGRQCYPLGFNLSDAQAADALFEAACEHAPSIDLLVNNASLFEYDSAAEFSPDLLQQHLGPNLIAPLQLTQRFSQQPQFSTAVEHGVVIHMLDQKLWQLNPDFFSYSLCKAALQSAVTMQAQALAPKVRVMGIAPGLTLPSHLQSQEDFDRTHRMAPLGRASTPQDICQTVLYIAQTSSLTGSTIIVDGGQHLVGFERDFSLL